MNQAVHNPVNQESWLAQWQGLYQLAQQHWSGMQPEQQDYLRNHIMLQWLQQLQQAGRHWQELQSSGHNSHLAALSKEGYLQLAKEGLEGAQQMHWLQLLLARAQKKANNGRIQLPDRQSPLSGNTGSNSGAHPQANAELPTWASERPASHAQLQAAMALYASEPLMHFSPRANLESILHLGLRPLNQLSKARVLMPEPSCSRFRQDCLSLSYGKLNRALLRQYQQRMALTAEHWLILQLDAALLGQAPTLFFPEHWFNPRHRHWRQQHQGFAYRSALAWHRMQAWPWLSQTLELDSQHQPEILYAGVIEPQHIQAIWLLDPKALPQVEALVAGRWPVRLLASTQPQAAAQA